MLKPHDLRPKRATPRVARSVTPIAAFVLALTSATSTHAFQTTGDLPELASPAPVRWESGTIRYAILEDVPAGFTLSETEAAVAHGFQTWSDLTCDGGTGGPQFVYVGPPTSAPSTVSFIGRGWFAYAQTYDAAGVTDAQFVRAPGEAWQVSETDMYLKAQTFQSDSDSRCGSAGWRHRRAGSRRASSETVRRARRLRSRRSSEARDVKG
jgi:hypothetical protein